MNLRDFRKDKTATGDDKLNGLNDTSFTKSLNDKVADDAFIMISNGCILIGKDSDRNSRLSNIMDNCLKLQVPTRVALVLSSMQFRPGLIATFLANTEFVKSLRTAKQNILSQITVQGFFIPTSR